MIKYPKGPVVFTQTVKVSDPSQPITVEVEYMSCNDETCTPPMLKDFSFDVSSVAAEDLTASNDAVADLQQAAESPEAAVSEVAQNSVITEVEEAPTTLTGEVAPSEDDAQGATSGLLEPVKWYGRPRSLRALRTESLPAPDGPTTATFLPGGMSKLTSSSTCRSGL